MILLRIEKALNDHGFWTVASWLARRSKPVPVWTEADERELQQRRAQHRWSEPLLKRKQAATHARLEREVRGAGGLRAGRAR